MNWLEQPLKLDHKKVEAVRKRWKKRKFTVTYDTDPTATAGAYQRAVKFASNRRRPPPPAPPLPEPVPDPPLPPYDDNDRRLWVLNHEPLYRMWQSSMGSDVDRNQADPLDDGFIEQHREEIDDHIRQQPGMENYPEQYACGSEKMSSKDTAAGLKKYALASDLAALLARARSDPYDPTLHGAIADELDQQFPDNKVSQLIRKQFGQGQYGGQGGQDYLWHDPFYNSYDGTHPYAARLGVHGPFNLYLLHEGSESQAERTGETGGNAHWVLRAESRLRGSRDCAYNFEVPHEQAHEISQAFPEARQYINPDPEVSAPPRTIMGMTPSGPGPRDAEANHFDNMMDEQERNRD